MRALARATLAGIALAAACSELPVIERGECGNLVVDLDKGEDCDGHAVGEGTVCGDPGGPKQCRYDCGTRDDGTRPACPQAMDCGIDGICRAPSGTFQRAGEPIPADAREIFVGDFDGDARQDLASVAAASLELRFFDRPGSVERAFVTPRDSVAEVFPVLGDLSQDGRADLLGPSTNGTVVSLGSAERTLLPTAYPAITLDAGTIDLRVIVVTGLPSMPGQDAVLLGSSRAGSALVRIDNPDLILLALVPGPASALAGEPGVGSLAEDPETSPCDEIILAYAGDTKAIIYTICKEEAGSVVWNDGGDPRAIDLPPGRTVVAGPVLLDVNDDQHLDIVVGASGDEIQVAYGLGDGTFHSDPDALVPGAGDDAFALFDLLPGPLPLALGDLDGDGLLDAVRPEAVLVSRIQPDSSVTFQPEALAGAVPWTEAEIADLNGNGIPDVIAGSAEAAGVQFFNGVGNGSLNAFEIPTAGPVGELAVGDFDGDIVNDLVLAERVVEGDTSSGTLGDSVSILFGRASGSPEPPVSMGRLDTIVQISPSHVVGKGGIVDGINDLVTLSRTAGDVFAFAGFSGRSDRVLRSPYVTIRPEDASTLTVFAPERYAIGRFDADDHPDVAILAREAGLAPGAPGPLRRRLWRVPSFGEARFDTLAALEGDLLDPEIDWSRSALCAVDLDRDGLDEVVALGPHGADPGAASAVARLRQVDPADPGTKTRWVLDAPRALGVAFARVEAASAAAPNARVITARLDDDEWPDLLLLPSDPSAGPRLIWNDGDGELGPLAALPELPPEPIVDLALIEAGGAAGPEIALLTAGGVYLVELAGRTPRLVGGGPRVTVSGGHLIAAGDVDGDGVDDLLVITSGGIETFAGQPVVR